MLPPLILVCFATILETTLSTPIWSSKPKPVDLVYTCTTVTNKDQENFKQEDVPIILLHGLSGNKEAWHGILEVFALETQKKVCAVDLRNHGESPWNDEEYDVVAMTEDVRHFMDHIKASKAIVLGHSLGGSITVHLALNYPERVEKVIIEDMRPNGVNPETMKGIKFFARMLKDVQKLIPQGVSEKEAKQEVLQLINEYLAKINMTSDFEDPSLIPVKCLGGKCTLSLNPVLLDAILRNVTDLINESSGRFNGPALFIYGTESPLKVDEDESNIKKLFPDAELVAVEGADHTVHTSRKFTTEVIKFIRS